MHETHGELCVLAELPGVAQQDVDVQLNGDMLSISGQTQSEYEEGDASTHYVMERSYGRFQRTIQLPFAPKPEDVKADFENGVLRIHMPAESGRRAHRITVGSGSTQDRQLSDSGGAKRAKGGSEQRH